MRTALGRVLGLGSAKTGTDDFVKDRIRGLLLLILLPYITGLAIWFSGLSENQARGAFASPFVSLPIGLFLAISVLHMHLGMRTIIEDYIHHSGCRLGLMLLNSGFSLVLCIAIFWALVRLALGIAPA
jgi:succinate dehydrogenase / fumarate reductase membrane anchor subunit